MATTNAGQEAAERGAKPAVAEGVLVARPPLRSLVEDLHERRERARAGGGPERIERQHAQGKLTARERLALLIDEGTFVELGIHGPVTERQREAISRIQRSQRHLLGLINDVLNFAKLEAGRVEYHLAAFQQPSPEGRH